MTSVGARKGQALKPRNRRGQAEGEMLSSRERQTEERRRDNLAMIHDATRQSRESRHGRPDARQDRGACRPSSGSGSRARSSLGSQMKGLAGDSFQWHHHRHQRGTLLGPGPGCVNLVAVSFGRLNALDCLTSVRVLCMLSKSR